MVACTKFSSQNRKIILKEYLKINNKEFIIKILVWDGKVGIQTWFPHPGGYQNIPLHLSVYVQGLLFLHSCVLSCHLLHCPQHAISPPPCQDRGQQGWTRGQASLNSSHRVQRSRQALGSVLSALGSHHGENCGSPDPWSQQLSPFCPTGCYFLL